MKKSINQQKSKFNDECFEIIKRSSIELHLAELIVYSDLMYDSAGVPILPSQMWYDADNGVHDWDWGF